MSGFVIQLGKVEGANSIRLGGPLAIVGGVLLLAAGISAGRVEQAEEAPAASGVPAT